MTAQHQVDSRLRPGRQRAFAPDQQVGQVRLHLGAHGMVRHHDAQLPGPRLAQPLGYPGDLRIGDLAVLAAPGARGIHADGQHACVLEHRLEDRAQGPLVVAVGIQRTREHVE
ncbi:hypothetical protein D3C71_1793080 [compost metagenome]